MKWLLSALAAFAIAIGPAAIAQQPASKPPTLITNARVFDGKNEKLLEGVSVLVEGNKIKTIAKSIKAPSGATVINAGGRVMSPGFIDMHYHVGLCSVRLSDLAGSFAPDLDYIGINAANEARRLLKRGFTSVRDVGGASWGAKLAADRGEIAGPRIWPTLRVLSQFGGHGDGSPRFLAPREFGGPENWAERVHYSRVVNGRAHVLAAVRENLKKGASQIKMHLAGGVGTDFDPIDGLQFTPEEIRAAVQAAKNFGTYVYAHVYTPHGIRVAIENGVVGIEHGNLLDEETARLMAKKGVWLSPQVLVYQTFTPDLGEARLAKGRMVRDGLDTMFRLAKKHGIKMVFGTDVVFNPKACAKQNDEFTARRKWFTPFEILRQATSLSGELLQLSGERSPYPGKIGVIEPGAYADLLLINGDPFKDISILTKPDKSLALIMKDGKIYKNTLK